MAVTAEEPTISALTDQSASLMADFGDQLDRKKYEQVSVNVDSQYQALYIAVSSQDTIHFLLAIL